MVGRRNEPYQIADGHSGCFRISLSRRGHLTAARPLTVASRCRAYPPWTASISFRRAAYSVSSAARSWSWVVRCLRLSDGARDVQSAVWVTPNVILPHQFFSTAGAAAGVWRTSGVGCRLRSSANHMRSFIGRG